MTAEYTPTTDDYDLAETLGRVLNKHRITTGMQVAMGATCVCGYWSGVEEPGKNRPVGFTGLTWHQSQEVVKALARSQ